LCNNYNENAIIKKISQIFESAWTPSQRVIENGGPHFAHPAHSLSTTQQGCGPLKKIRYNKYLKSNSVVPNRGAAAP